MRCGHSFPITMNTEGHGHLEHLGAIGPPLGRGQEESQAEVSVAKWPGAIYAQSRGRFFDSLVNFVNQFFFLTKSNLSWFFITCNQKPYTVC